MLGLFSWPPDWIPNPATDAVVATAAAVVAATAVAADDAAPAAATVAALANLIFCLVQSR